MTTADFNEAIFSLRVVKRERETERDRDRDRERQTERKRERESFTMTPLLPYSSHTSPSSLS